MNYEKKALIYAFCCGSLPEFCLSFAVSAFAASSADIYDEADLLSTQEETQLAEKLSEIGEEFDAQIVIMTVSSTNGNIDAYIEEMFDGMNMGYGEKRDGVLLLVCMDDREYRILSNGYAGIRQCNSVTIDGEIGRGGNRSAPQLHGIVTTNTGDSKQSP